MSRFLIHTGGRTGSSAIREELNNHPNIVCYGEIFRSDPFKWPGVKAAYEEFGKDYPLSGKTSDRVLPFRLYCDLAPEDPITDSQFAAYWHYLDNTRASSEETAVGLKALNNHLRNPPAFELCAKNNILLLVLRRRNELRQTISRHVAKTVNVYNRVNYVPEKGRIFEVDIEKIIKTLKRKKRQNERYDNELAASGAHYQFIYYEDWLSDREAFFRPVFKTLGVPFRLPQNTTLSRMTPEPLPDLIQNYDKFATAVSTAGFDEFLEQ